MREAAKTEKGIAIEKVTAKNRRNARSVDYRMVCLDLDGTLLNSGGHISARNRRAILDCLGQGTAVFLVTGRPYCYTKYLALSIEKERSGVDTEEAPASSGSAAGEPRRQSIGVICSNGACYELGKQVVTHEIPPEAVVSFIDCMRNFRTEDSGHRFSGFHGHAYLKGQREFYTHSSYDPRFLYDHMNGLFGPELSVRSHTELSYDALRRQSAHILKILVVDEDREELNAFRRTVSAVRGFSISSYNSVSFEVVAEGIHKGSAIDQVGQWLGFPRAQIAAVGDSENDRAMMETVGLRIAMGNASQQIKDIADALTLSNDEDGVAAALENYILVS